MITYYYTYNNLLYLNKLEKNIKIEVNLMNTILVQYFISILFKECKFFSTLILFELAFYSVGNYSKCKMCNIFPSQLLVENLGVYNYL